MNRLYESMTLCSVQHFRVRVWRTETAQVSGPDVAVVQALKALSFDYRYDRLTPELIAGAIDALDRIAAFEILDLNGNGSIVYPDWN